MTRALKMLLPPAFQPVVSVPLVVLHSVACLAARSILHDTALPSPMSLAMVMTGVAVHQQQDVDIQVLQKQCGGRKEGGSLL